ncbi:thioredoxin domain-containing protein [Parathermosynechococcus lividus]
MTNRLAQCQSLYLRKHAENPIDWWPWGEAALAKAAAEDRVIFLSIGYSSCHWCTVMEGEAFSDLEIAAYLNQYFLPIKVDREERPDIDSLYMHALQLMTGQGGWPLNIFLTPQDCRPFYGGTYFPLQPRYGRPGFLQVLHAVRRFYDEEKAKLTAQQATLWQYLAPTTDLSPELELNRDLLCSGIHQTMPILEDRPHGTCFPMIPYAQALLQGVVVSSEAARLEGLCRQRGTSLLLGGIYDHVGGGWHRYTVDPQWTVPHFEKMLYDNGQIITYLARLWQQGDRHPHIPYAIAQTVQWLDREMTAPQGYFYAAQDADSFRSAVDPEPEEGAFYCWDYNELTAHLSPEELSQLQRDFEISPQGNFEGKIVLKARHRRQDPAAIAPVLDTLFALRYGAATPKDRPMPVAMDNRTAKGQPWLGRIPPVTDTKMILAWNSLMITGLATAALVWQQQGYWQRAVRAAQWLHQHQLQGNQLYRLNYGGAVAEIAQAEDYAYWIQALLTLHQASLVLGDAATPWLELACDYQDRFDQHLGAADGGYYNAPERPDLILRQREGIDQATPSANGVAIANLMQLFLLTDNPAYLTKAETSLRYFGALLKDSPQSCPSLLAALQWYLYPVSLQIRAETMDQVSGYWLPTAVLKLRERLSEGEPQPLALVCEGLRCREPAFTLEQLHAHLASLYLHH